MSCLNKLLDAYKEVCRYNDASVNADSLFSYFEYKLKKNNINPKPVRVEYEGEYVYDDYPPDIFFSVRRFKKILKETPFELESAECEEKISTLYNWYCKEYYAAEPLKYFDDYSLDEVLKNLIYVLNGTKNLMKFKKQRINFEFKNCKIIYFVDSI